MANDWITIFDNTQEARVVYVSESITDYTGWEPEDVIGREAYELFHPGDHNSLRKVHLVNKDGSYIKIETIVHYCHDVIIGCNFLYDSDSLDHKARVNSVDEIFICHPDGSLQLAGAWNNRQEDISLSLEKVWNRKNHQIILNQERRFCLILNRFAEALNIVLCFQTVNKTIGTPLLNFVQENDLPSLLTQTN
ncbi:uncharacterized protein BX663DRAFT_518934 [Cokeromyces recurvatus]|uniref:uncharacterized protein n=1 Tax=Cokeromyces recurvatus TaxID=90255 RepID=UPI00221F7252